MDLSTFIPDLILMSPIMIFVIAAVVTMLVSAFSQSSGPVQVVMILAYLTMGIAAVMTQHPGEYAFSGMMVSSGISTVGAVIISILGILHTLLAKPAMDHTGEYVNEFFVITAFAVSGMLMMIYANSLIMIFIGIETMSIPFYVLATIARKDARSNEAGMKYFLIGAFASGFLLYGIALIYGDSSHMQLDLINQHLAANGYSLMMWIGLGLLLVGFLFKVSAAPFHFWAPDVYQGAPSASSALLATGGKIAAFTTLILIAFRMFPEYNPKWTGILLVVSAISMIIGNLTALPQTNVKRILGFSSVAHAGYILLGFLPQTHLGYQSVLFYILVYGITTMVAFSIIGLLEHQGKGLNIDNLKGLGFKYRFEGAVLAIAMFSLMGLPPFGGFIGKYLIFVEAYQQGFFIPVMIGILTSMISIGYYLKIIIALYSRDEKTEFTGTDIPVVAKVGIAGALIVILITGIMPSIVLNYLLQIF